MILPKATLVGCRAARRGAARRPPIDGQRIRGVGAHHDDIDWRSRLPRPGAVASDEVLAAADKALYRAKAEGRDRVAVAVGHQAQGSASTGA